MKENPKFQMAAFALSIALSKGLSLIMLPIFTRFLTPAEMGELELVATTMAVLGILISFALHEALYRFATKNGLTRADQIFTLTFALSLFARLLLLLWLQVSEKVDLSRNLASIFWLFRCLSRAHLLSAWCGFACKIRPLPLSK